MSTPSSPGYLEPAPCHLPGLSLGLSGPPGVFPCVQALLPDYFPPPGVHRASFDKRPRLRAPFTSFPPELHTAPFKLGPPSQKSPFLTQETSPHSEILLFPRESLDPLEHAPSPPPGGPYLLPRVPLPSHIPVRRSGGPETVESSVRGPGTLYSSCSGSRAGLGSPPKPGRSRRHPHSLRCRRRRGACSSSPCERPASCQCAGATARPRGRTGTSQAGRSDGNKGQWRGAGAPGTRGSGPWWSPAAMQLGGRALVKARRNRAVAWGGAGKYTLQQPPAPCLLPKQVPSSLCIASPLCTEPRAHYRNPTSFPGPPHTLRAPHRPRALPPTSPPNLSLHALAAKLLPPRSLVPSLVTELPDATLISKPSARHRDHRYERGPAYYLGRFTVSTYLQLQSYFCGT